MRLSADILIDERRLQERVEEIALAIAADSAGGDALSVIALMDGAFMFCADLVRRLPMPVHLALAPVTSVLRGGDPSTIALPPGFPVTGADVLVVEDIHDTGQTLAALLAHLETLSPARIRLAVLLEKPVRRERRVPIDYLGFQVPDRWVVGYGMDADGLYRNLPYVSYVE
jgi:hypoxanthine phosphoribosyltransferase